MKKTLLVLSLAAAAVAILSLGSCSTTHPRRDPTGERFPAVTGTSLAGDPVALPEVGAGQPLLLLIGYEQNAQFDLDRWLLALSQADLGVRAYEVPTIPGLVPGLLSGMIDGGMRRGIPAEDWGGVVTVYGDAAEVAEFTGNEDGLTGRIVLLDGEGEVVFFHDRGYSVGTLQRLRAAVDDLEVARPIDPAVLIGTWQLDLRSTPEAAPEHRELVIHSVANGELRGTCDGVELEHGRVEIAWGELRLAFATTDAMADYHSSALLTGERLVGTTHVPQRSLLSRWTAEKRD